MSKTLKNDDEGLEELLKEMEKKLFNSRAESPAEDWGRKWICRNTNQYNLLIQINFSLLLHGILNWAGDS